MFNLIKFEIFKRKKIFTTLGVIFALVQLYVIYQFSITTEEDPLAYIFLLTFVSYVIYLFSSLTNFSKDINSIDRSMSFIVPKSGFKIVSAKFIATFLLGVGLLAVGSAMGLLNIYFKSPAHIKTFTTYTQANPYVIAQVILGILTLGSFFALVFLSIIITKTFLSKLKFKTFITMIVLALLSKIFNLIFWDTLSLATMLNIGIAFVGTITITTIMLWISGWLIDNKTDF